MARDFARKLYKSKQWIQTRDYCLKRDRYLCVHCGQPAEEVHHIIHLSPQNINDVTITLNPDNLASLCRACHFEQHRGEHGSGRKRKEEINNIYGFENLTFNENGELVPPIE